MIDNRGRYIRLGRLPRRYRRPAERSENVAEIAPVPLGRVGREFFLIARRHQVLGEGKALLESSRMRFGPSLLKEPQQLDNPQPLLAQTLCVPIEVTVLHFILHIGGHAAAGSAARHCRRSRRARCFLLAFEPERSVRHRNPGRIRRVALSDCCSQSRSLEGHSEISPIRFQGSDLRRSASDPQR